MNNKWDVVIIGGGLAGYVAANCFSNKNLSVLVLEKNRQTGGRARTHNINGQYFNLGPHALYKKGKATSILKSFGIELHGQSPKLDGMLMKDTQFYNAPFTPAGLLSTTFLNWKERLEWLKIIMKIKSININAIVGLTFQQWVNQTVHSENIQTLLFALSRLATYCHAPELLSASLVIYHIQTVLGGVLYIDRGWQSIIDQLHNKAIISGTHVENEKPVKKIMPDQHSGINIVLANDEVIQSKYVICTSSPSELNQLLGEGSQLGVLNQLIPVRGATLDVALSKLPNPKQLFALGISAPLYFSVHSNYANLSDNGKSVILHLFKYYHPLNTYDHEQVRDELEQFLDALQPNWKQYLITSRFIPKITVNQRLPQLGEEHTLLSLETSIDGLYLAGDWACPYSILAEGAVSSAVYSAEHIIQKEKW